MDRTDVAVVGGGIIGLATAHALLRSAPDLKVVVLEKEDRAAVHQSGHNSGVIHSGVYYRPGSLKASTVAAGRAALLELCQVSGIPHDICGKVIVATDESERRALHELALRAQGSGVPAELIGPHRLAELEPHAVGVAALHVPSAAIVDFAKVCVTLVGLLETAGGEFRPQRTVLGLVERGAAVVVSTDQGEIEARVAVNCAGLHSDHLVPPQRPSGTPELRIVPFRGEYRRLADPRAYLVRSMIYPVPDVRFPFLGTHFTRGIGGEVHAGPNAVLALAREGYSWRTVDLRDTWSLIRFPGFRRLCARYWRTGITEMRRSLSEAAFLRSLQRLVPEIEKADLLSSPAGVRAQAVAENGVLVEDFVLQESARVVHVLNAPSPAATASLEIGRRIAERVSERLG